MNYFQNFIYSVNRFCLLDSFFPGKLDESSCHLRGVWVMIVSEYMIVKCFKDCGQKKFGHYHCVFCKEQIIKRNAYGRHLSRHMRKKVRSGIG